MYTAKIASIACYWDLDVYFHVSDFVPTCKEKGGNGTIGVSAAGHGGVQVCNIDDVICNDSVHML